MSENAFRKVTDVPLGRYLAFVGPVLLALLFLAPWYLQDELALRGPNQPSVDRTTIRIQSGQKWPDKVVIDTTLPTIIPEKPQVVAASAPIAPATTKLGAVAEMKPPPAPPKHASIRPKRRIVRQSPPPFGYATHMAANPFTTWPPSW